MNTEKLNAKLQSDIKNRLSIHVGKVIFDTLKGTIQHANNETLDIYLQHLKTYVPSQYDIDTLYLFDERKMLTKTHIEYIINQGTDVETLFDRIRLNYDNDTLIIYGTRHLYYRQLNECPALLLQFLNTMIDNKQIINDDGARIICTYVSLKLVIKYLNIFFDMGYVPSIMLIKYLADTSDPTKRDTSTIFINEIIITFKLLPSDAIKTYCKARRITLHDKPLTIEDKFKYYKMSCFKKEIKDDTKMTQQCLYNACSLPNNIASVKTLITKYNLKLDTKCLEISTSIPNNTKVNNYLVDSGAYVSNQCVFNLIRNGTCKVLNKWKDQQFETSNIVQINGIDDL